MCQQSHAEYSESRAEFRLIINRKSHEKPKDYSGNRKRDPENIVD